MSLHRILWEVRRGTSPISAQGSADTDVLLVAAANGGNKQHLSGPLLRKLFYSLPARGTSRPYISMRGNSSGPATTRDNGRLPHVPSRTQADAPTAPKPS